MSKRTGQEWAGETSKAHARRLREGFYNKYIRGRIIDIGCADDPIVKRAEKWDYSLGRGDATEMASVPDNTYDTVYASHVLEHLEKPVAALRSWWRILKPGGFLIVCVPEKDLYEKSATLPSRWNSDHKSMWKLCFGIYPPTYGLIEAATLAFNACHLHSLRILDYGYDANGDGHPQGEYSIELIAKK